MQKQNMSDLKTYRGLTFKKLYDEQYCTKVIQRLAKQINEFYEQFKNQTNESQTFELVAVCLLKGAFMFYSDLCKKLNMKIICEFVRVSSYKGQHSTGQITIQGGFTPEKFKGKHVLIIQDMADTGLTLQKFKNLMESSQPKSLKVAVLVNRPDKTKNYTIDWIGMQCSDFIVGYGLDYCQFGRTFPAIYQKV